MNTPSKEALEAAKELVYSYDPKAHEAGARAIDRHFAPLRQRAEQAEARVKELEGMLDLASRQRDYNQDKISALRAANTELETLLASEKATRNAIIAKGVATEQANAELAGALRDAAAFARNMEQLAYGGIEEIDDEECVSLACRAEAVLARHAAGEPAKHPDTERLEAIEDGGLDVFESDGEWYVGAAEPCRTLRAAIDAAAAKHCKEVQS